MSFTVRCRAEFEAAHHLRDYVGGPEPVHGHSWKVEVALETDALGGGSLSAQAGIPSGSVDLVLDVSGYFR